MKKESKIFIVIVILCASYYLVFMNNDGNNETKTNVKEQTKDQTVAPGVCPEKYKCVEVDGKEHYFSVKKEIEVTNIYNYDTDEKEAGKLTINKDKKLYFIDLENKPIKTYNEFDSEVISIDSVKSSCDDVFFVALTSDGSVYRTDADDLLIEEPFFKIETDSKIIDISLYDSMDECNNVIYALTSDNKIINLR